MLVQILLPVQYSSKLHERFESEQKEALAQIDHCVSHNMTLLSHNPMTLGTSAYVHYLFFADDEPDWDNASLEDLKDCWDMQMSVMAEISRAIGKKDPIENDYEKLMEYRTDIQENLAIGK